ncbi:hypothetical protein N8J89_07865 [Crossiella sp. CA-258035]|uniref:hypothetical protein n=1 Tax=Crossiella sp. CA-258035 TaxID=2981138 RepID=UPI0024BC4D3B|nr:hypothetical protein [Crossiella sp. CA-258035]WHT20970.1 hypothetical protein N8J89_07865 [Crossiella sp. CA-258035]
MADHNHYHGAAKPRPRVWVRFWRWLTKSRMFRPDPIDPREAAAGWAALLSGIADQAANLDTRRRADQGGDPGAE